MMMEMPINSKQFDYLTIRQQARVVYEQIVNEAQPSWLSFIDSEGKLSNCFSINQLVGLNIILKKRTETLVVAIVFEFENRFLLLLVVYHQ